MQAAPHLPNLEAGDELPATAYVPPQFQVTKLAEAITGAGGSQLDNTDFAAGEP